MGIRPSLHTRWQLLLPAALIVAAAGVAPFAEAVVTSFFHDIYGQRSPAGFDNYRYLLSDRGFSYSLRISLVWALGNTVLGLGASLLLAWRIFMRGKKGRLLYFSLVIPWAVPVYIAVPVWRSFFHGDGGTSLFSTLTGIHINLLTDPVAAFCSTLWVSVWLSVPFTGFVLLSSLKRIPGSLREAAMIDGADSRQVLQYIYLPQIRNAIAVMSVLNVIKFLKEFNVIFLMTSGGPPLVSGITDRFIIGATTTLDVLVYEIFQTREDIGISSAYAVLLAGVVILIMLLWLRARKEHSSRILPAVLTGLAQVPFSGIPGIILAVLYPVSGIVSRKAFSLTLILHAGLTCFLVISRGFLEGFSPGFPLALLVYLIIFSKDGAASRPVKTPQGFSQTATRLFTLTTLVLSCLFIIAALLMVFIVIWLSFSGLGSSYIDSLIPPFPTVTNYVKIIVDEGILRHFLNTLLLSGSTAVLLPLIIMPAAYYLLHRGNRTAFGVLTFLQILGLYGGMHSLIPLYSFFRRLHLIDSYIPLVMIYLNHAIPSALFTTLAYMEKIPASFEDQARLEGVSAFQYLRLILFPVSLPIIGVNMVLAFIAAWNGFMAPLLFLNTEGSFPISVKLFSLVGNLASGFPKWNLFAAASLINCLILSVLLYRVRKPINDSSLQSIME